MSALDIDCPLVEQTLCGFINEEIGKFGVGKAVFGMSGGIDSTVSAYLAARALGPENVLGIIMPYKLSNPESQAHAELAAVDLGIETLVVDITPMIDAYFEVFPDADNSRRGNKMARERMTILYDHSARLGAMVLGTSNKTEILLGYTTIWGDMASAINPIGDLYKTQLWQLARHLNVPAPIIDKKPSADLWEGQTDEGELGFTYEDVDKVFYELIDRRRKVDEIVADGFDRAFVEKAYRMVRDSQYKRRMPLIAKLSHRSMDRDFRYSRDWGR
ncbi:MAG TPA: NAD+ synthase [Armatimonadota bacterium]|nr:NAD+ synthase [Armatimonadota bacterium]